MTATPDAEPFLSIFNTPAKLPAKEAIQPGHRHFSLPANQFPETTGGRPRSATLVITRPDGKPIAA
jgi:hypothetical protein